VPSGYLVMYGITVAVVTSVSPMTSVGNQSTVSCTLTVHGAQVGCVNNGVDVIVFALSFGKLGEEATWERIRRACWSNDASSNNRLRKDSIRTSVFMFRNDRVCR